MDPDAVWDGEWGRLRDECIKPGGCIVQGEEAVSGVKRPIVTNGGCFA